MVRLMLGVFLLGALLGSVVAYFVFRTPDPVSSMAFLPAQRLPGGALIPVRIPDAHPPLAPHVLPPGSTELRRVHVVIQPAAHTPPAPVHPGADGLCPSVPQACPEVAVDVSLVRTKAGTRTVVSSPDGRALADQTFDTPIVDDHPQELNAVTILGDPRHGTYTAAYARRLQNFRPFGLPVDADAAFSRSDNGRVTPAVGFTVHF